MSLQTGHGLAAIGTIDSPASTIYRFGNYVEKDGGVTWYILADVERRPGEPELLLLMIGARGEEAFICEYDAGMSLPDTAYCKIISHARESLSIYLTPPMEMRLDSQRFGALITPVSLDDCDIITGEPRITVREHMKLIPVSKLGNLIAEIGVYLLTADADAAVSKVGRLIDAHTRPLQQANPDDRYVPVWCLNRLKQVLASAQSSALEAHISATAAMLLARPELVALSIFLQTKLVQVVV